MVLKILLLLCAFFISYLSANSINVTPTDEPINILTQTKIYVDKGNKKEFQYILQNSKNLFRINKKDFLHLGYTSDAVWLKFSIKNSTNSEIKKVLEISNQMLDNIFLYTKESNNKYIKKENGVLYSKGFNENILNMYFNISLKPGEVKEYYLKISSLSCALYFKLNLMSKDQLYQKEISHQLILALFFGGMATLIIYNLFIFIFTKNIAYLYYTLYLFFTALDYLSYTLFNVYIFSKSMFDFDIYLTTFYMASLFIFAILFTREFLNVKKYKIIDSTFKGLVILSILFIVLSAFFPFVIMDFIVFIAMLAFIYLISVSFYLLYMGEKNAKFMVIGWSIATLGWVMQASFNFGSWSLIRTYPYFFEIAIFSEAILFSIALAHKLNTTKELEKSVSTNKVLTRELHHRVKNNMQFIISMYRLKLSKFSNKDITDSLKEVEGTIQAMSTTHEMLYTKNINTTIDTKEYFTTLIQKLQNSYDTSKIDIRLNITTDLNVKDSIYVGIILNELITNSFKYAFENKNGQIIISLSDQDRYYHLTVQDDGIGFNDEQTNETFGIELVNTLVKDELKGTLKLDTTNGSQYTIKWL